MGWKARTSKEQLKICNGGGSSESIPAAIERARLEYQSTTTMFLPNFFLDQATSENWVSLRST